MDAKRNMAKEPQPREGESRQMEGLGLETVIQRAQGRDAEALAEIYRRYVRRVFGLCRYMLNSREGAEDATSEVFLKLQRSIERYDGSIPFPRWLLRVAGNQCIDALRRRQRGQKVFAEVDDGSELAASMTEAPSSTSTNTFRPRCRRRKASIHWLPATRSSHLGNGIEPSYLSMERCSLRKTSLVTSSALSREFSM